MATVSTTPPAFNLTYDVKPIDIGSGYAEGIGQAGASIADALKGVTSIMSQSQSANEMIQGLTQMKDSAGNPVISTDEAESLYGKSLGARKDLIAEHLLRFHAQYSSAINQQNELERIRATAATAAPYRQAEIVTTGEQQRKTAELEARLALLKNPDSRLIKNPPAAAATTTTAPTTAAADSVKSPLQKTIDTSKNPKPGTNVLKLFPQL